MARSSLLSGRSRWCWLLSYALVTMLSFPHPLGDGALDLGLVLSWFSPALLLLGLTGLPPLRAARSAFLASWLAHAGVLHWLYIVTVRYGHAPVAVGLLAPLALAIYIASFSALFAASWAWLRGRGADSPLLAAMLWVVVDHLRSFVFSGFPWATLGYAQHQNRLLLPLVSVTGVYGLSFITTLAGAACAGLMLSGLEGGRPRRRDWLALLAVALLHGFGWSWGSATVATGSREVVRVAAVQANIDQDLKWSPEHVERTFAIYEDLSRRAARQGAELIVWPESAVPAALELDEGAMSRLSRLARVTGAAYLVGAVGVELDREGLRIARYYDSAFPIAASGRVGERYDKSHLVPFGEYVPLRGLLGQQLAAVASGIAPADVSAGEAPRSLEIPLRDRRVKVAVPICYELLFPDLVRRFADDGARMFLAITNDAWYGRTGAPYQFLAMTALRSAETGVWTVRAANTGVSAIIDAEGRVRKQTALFEADFVVADVPLTALEGGRTFYTRYGDVFVWVCWLGLTVAAVSAGIRPSYGATTAVVREMKRGVDD